MNPAAQDQTGGTRGRAGETEAEREALKAALLRKRKEPRQADYSETIAGARSVVAGRRDCALLVSKSPKAPRRSFPQRNMIMCAQSALLCSRVLAPRVSLRLSSTTTRASILLHPGATGHV